MAPSISPAIMPSVTFDVLCVRATGTSVQAVPGAVVTSRSASPWHRSEVEQLGCREGVRIAVNRLLYAKSSVI